MNFTRPITRRLVLPLICAMAAGALEPSLFAQATADQVKAAGGIAITAELLGKIEKFASTVAKDPEAKTEWVTSDNDPAMTPDSAAGLIPEKYPKLNAAFKAAELTPADFIKAYGAIMTISRIAGTSATVDDKVAQANLAFYKDNKERFAAVVAAVDGLNKTPTSPSPTAH